MDKVKRLYEWGEWERNEFDQCGSRIRQATDKSVTDTMSAHRRKHMTETLSDEEHTTLMAKRGELAGDAIHDSTVGTLSLIDTSKTATGQSLKGLESTRAKGTL